MGLSGLPTVKYCEQPLDFFLKRPWYALSGLSYIFLGLYLVIWRKTELARKFGMLSLTVGLSSIVYDITYSYWSQLVDLTAMYLVAAGLIYFSYRVKRPALVPSLVAMVILSLAATMFFGGYAGNIIFGLMIGYYLLREAISYRKTPNSDYRRLLIGLVLMFVGVIFWYSDTAGIYCLRFGLLNGRAIFHYFGALAFYQIYLFYEMCQTEGN